MQFTEKGRIDKMIKKHSVLNEKEKERYTIRGGGRGQITEQSAGSN